MRILPLLACLGALDVLAAQTINLAPGGVATQSSSVPVGYPVLANWAIDGNRDGYWWNNSTTSTANDPSGSWWQVALPAAATMHEIVLYNRADCCTGRLSNFRLEAKLAGAVVFSQDLLTTGEQLSAGAALRVLLPGGRVADTVRISTLGYNAEGSFYLQLAEVEVLQYGALRESNVAAHAPATQSSTDGIQVPGLALDQNTNGYAPSQSFARTLDAPGAWFEVAIPSGSIDRIQLWPVTYGQLGCGNFRVAVYLGGNQVWGQNLLPSSSLPLNGPTIVTPPLGIVGDAVRISTLGPLNGHERLEFAEVEVIRRGNAVADRVAYGIGCSGSNGLPFLFCSERPALGTSFTSHVRNLPLTPGLALLVVGLSNASWNGLPLPLHLAPLGLPGCWSLASFDLSVVGLPLAGDPASSLIDLQIPLSPTVAGTPLYLQALVFDAAMPNPFGATVTNGVRAYVGF